jgi:hypothetical protein
MDYSYTEIDPGSRIFVYGKENKRVRKTPMDLDHAREMMVYAADLLGYECPDDLPEIRVETDLECLGQIRWSWLRAPLIALRQLRDGNLFDQSVLVHELVHHIQRCNDVEITGNNFYHFDPTEVEAITVQCLWLLSVGENPRDHLSEAAIYKMTGDQEFAQLRWLKEKAGLCKSGLRGANRGVVGLPTPT